MPSFNRKVRKVDRELGEAIIGFFECRHRLFEDEADYVICPSCGELLRERLPQDGRDKARLYLIQKKLKKFWLVRTDVITVFVALGLSLLLPNYLSRLILSWKDYGFDRFILPRYKTYGLEAIAIYGYLPLYLFFLGGEGFKRTNIFSLAFKHFYRFWYAWPVRLLLYILVLTWINSYAPPVFAEQGRYYMAEHEGLALAQQEKGVELFVFINLLSVWILAGILAIFEGLNALKTRLIKRANETYLAGLREENE